MPPQMSESKGLSAAGNNLDDPRMGDLLQKRTLEEAVAVTKKHPDKPHIVLVGFPWDEGTRRNGGRVGAADAPSVVRKFVQRFGPLVNPETGADLNKLLLSDVGDVSAAGTLEEAHEELRKTVSQLIAAGAIPFVLGGSNDQSYPNASALLDHHRENVTVVNIDAHLDVRPLKEGKAHSGSPFRQLLEDPRFAGSATNKFVEFAVQGNQCSKEHADYVTSKGGIIYWLSKVRASTPSALFQQGAIASGSHIFVSFDIDAIASADCPGVSAPAVVGLSADDALAIAQIAGSDPRVCLFDVSEFNPKAEDYRTGRLVATILYFFACGVACAARERTKLRGLTAASAGGSSIASLEKTTLSHVAAEAST